MRIVIAAALLLLTTGARAHEGWGIVVHERLGVVVSDIPGNRIWRIDGGRAEPLIRGVHSHALVRGSDGAIYGTDAKPDGSSVSVWRIDAARRFSYVLPPATNSPLGLQSFLITRDGAIYTANRYDHRKPSVVLLRRERGGRITPLGAFASIDGMTELADGTVVIIDGVVLRTVSSVRTPPLTRRRWGEDLLGVSSMRDGSVHVADHAGRRVLRVSLADGGAAAVDRSSFFWAPSGVEVRGDELGDELYVLEHLRPPLSLLGDLQLGPYLRVRRVARGASTTLGVVWGRHTAKVLAVLAALLAIAVWIRRRRA